ncbi:helix-turn-helix transcriptional regulator [Candidatus Poribacteria bacterium]|nr:helix-turn-helix transcriptional regulator [Candidatus Poribacteria bacterium]
MMTNNVNPTLGEKIKNIRLGKRITLDAVAKQTNLTPSFLSQIERNIASPSVDSLRKIASALGTKIITFFEENKTNGLVLLKKRNKKNVPEDFRTYTIRLINDIFNINLHPFFILLSYDNCEKDLPSHNDEEFGMVIKGQVLLSMDGASHIMDEGDCIYLTSPGKHKITNTGNMTTELLWIYNSSKF